VIDDQRAAATPPEDAAAASAPNPPSAPSAADAGLAVPWSARQALTGGALTLVPLIGLQVWAALSIPRAAATTTHLTPRQDWIAAIIIVLSQLLVEGVFLLAPWYYVRKFLPRERFFTQATGTLGFRRFDLGRAVTFFLVGLFAVFGFNAFYSIFGLRTNADALVQQASRAPVSTIATLLMAVTIVPVCEEIFFRGYLFPGLARAMPVWAAIITSSLIFGAAHADLNSFAPLVVIGAALALLRWRTGSLWPGILFHAAINASVLLYVIGLLARR
jgi:membrane protease YdiL (CAAX protease family)